MPENFDQNQTVTIAQLQQKLAEAEALIEQLKAGNANGAHLESNSLASTTRNIIEENNLQHARLVAIVQSSQDAIIGKTTEGIVTSWNPGAEKIFGYRAEEMIGQSITKIIPQELIHEEPEILRKIKNGEIIKHFETKRRGKDGRLLDISLTVSPIKDGNGVIIGASKIARDITEAKLARTKIEQSEKLLEQVSNSVPALIFYLDSNMRYSMVNNAFEDWFHVKRKNVIGLTVKEFVGEKAWAVIKPHLQKAYDGIKEDFTTEIEYSKGPKRWIHATYTPSFNNEGNVTGVIVLVTDVSEQKETERIIQESEKELHQLLWQAPVSITLTHGKDLVVKIANEKALDIMGRTSQEVINRPLETIFPELHERINLYRQVFKTGISYNGSEVEITFMRKGIAHTGYFDVNYSPWKDSAGNIKGVMTVGVDVTAKLLAKKAIEKSERELKKITDQLDLSIEAGNIGLWNWDVKTDQLKWSKQQAALYGLPDADSIKTSKDFHRFIVKDDLEIILNKEHATLEQPYTQFVIRIKRANDGQIRWIFCRSKNLYNAAGELESITGINIDITEQRLAEELLQQSQQELYDLSNAVPQLVWMADNSGNVIYCNRRINEFTAEAKNINGAWLWDKLLHPDDLPATTQAWAYALAHTTPYEKEHRLQLKDGSYRWFLSRAYPQNDKQGNVTQWYGTATDIHQQKLHETQKDDFLKMVSHELKTPITSVKGYVELLLEMLQKEENSVSALVQQPLKRIDFQIDRIGKLISELLDISRLEDGRLDMSKETFRLDELVKETVQDVLFANRTHQIIIKQHFACTVEADKSRIGQALINLINNAIKYSQQCNVVEVSMQQLNNEFVAIGVRDYGMGIDSSQYDKIFQRFYQVSTHKKQNYSGFGIGLYITSEIIKRHGGTITVSSDKTEGTLFTFTLPFTAVL